MGSRGVRQGPLGQGTCATQPNVMVGRSRRGKRRLGPTIHLAVFPGSFRDEEERP